MSTGKLRVYLGAAPGVGKTYAMLEEGHRLLASGRDVVIGYVEPHARVGTVAMLGDLEVVPRRRMEYRGARRSRRWTSMRCSAGHPKWR